MYHPIVKEQVIPGLLEGLQTNPNPNETLHSCQPYYAVKFAIACGFLRPILKASGAAISNCTLKRQPTLQIKKGGPKAALFPAFL
jgi:hypothetical protein